MVKRKKLTVFLVVLLVFCQSFTAFAQESQGEFDAYRQKLEQKYSIRISYATTVDGLAAIGTGSLYTLDMALANLTPGVVKQVSDYYQKKLGTPLGFQFVYSPLQETDPELALLGMFDDKQADIHLFIPSSSTNIFTTGCNPLTIAHEFAHAYYQMYLDLDGKETLQREWNALNGGVAYNPGYMAYAYNKVVFMSSYAATGPGEDFAETFAHAFVRNKPGQGIYHRLSTDNQKTALGNKVEYLKKMLPKYLTGTEAAIANLNKVYTTPIFLDYQGLRLTGDETVFIGCSAPRYVLNGILGMNGLSGASAQWIIEIGGWQVQSANGQYYAVFPGGAWTELQGPLKTAA